MLGEINKLPALSFILTVSAGESGPETPLLELFQGACDVGA